VSSEVRLPELLDLQILEVCREVAGLTEQFTADLDQQLSDTSSLYDTTEKLEQAVGDVLTELNGQ